MNYTKSFSTVHTKHWECFIIQGKLNMSEIFKGFGRFWSFVNMCSSDLKSVRSLTAQIDKLEMAMAMLQTSTHFSVGVNNATQAAMNKRYFQTIITQSWFLKKPWRSLNFRAILFLCWFATFAPCSSWLLPKLAPFCNQNSKISWMLCDFFF